MLFDSERRHSLPATSLLVSLFLLIVASCTVAEMPVQVNPPNVNPAVTGNITAPSMLDIKSFTAQPKTIKQGENTVLAWKVNGASSIAIDPAIGGITGNTGNVSLSPRETTLYTLRASDGRNEISARFLVIVKTADGTIIWPGSGSDNSKAETLYEGWSYYPNKYVEWRIADRYNYPHGDSGNCWHVGYITNNHSKWMMTEITVSNKLVADFILPSTQRGYTVSIDCLQLPELKWKWKVYQ